MKTGLVLKKRLSGLLVPTRGLRPGKRVFTLIELLVVIAIIAILASMLLPALKKARETVVTSKCQGNLKQLALGINMYAQDFDGYLPISSSTPGERWFFYQLMGQYAGAPKSNSGDLRPTAFWCPLEKRKLRINAMHAAQEWDAYVPNYAYNSWGTDIYTNIKRIREPSKKFVLADGSHRYFTSLVIDNNGVLPGINVSNIWARHASRFNRVMLDAHVDSHPPTVPGSAENIALKNEADIFH